MAITRLKRKHRKNIARANNKQRVIKQLLATPVIKNVDIEELKAQFGKNPVAATPATNSDSLPVKETPAANTATESSSSATTTAATASHSLSETISNAFTAVTDKAGDIVETVKDKVEDVVEAVKDKVEDVTGSGQEEAPEK